MKECTALRTMSQPFDLSGQQQCSSNKFFELYILLLAPALIQKFFSNLAIAKLVSSETLKKYTSQLKITHWQRHDEYVRLIWDHIAASDTYAAYLAENQSDFNSDKNALITLFTDVIAPYERLHELIEEIKSSWVDDFPLVNTIVRNTLIHMHEDSDPKQLILTSIYKDDDDRKFAVELLESVVVHDKELAAQLVGHTVGTGSLLY